MMGRDVADSDVITVGFMEPVRVGFSAALSRATNILPPERQSRHELGTTPRATN